MIPVRRSAAAVVALALAAGLPLATALPALAVTPGESLAATAGVGGYSTGTAVFTDALNSGGDPDLARLSLAQSAAGAATGEALVDQDLLGSSILSADEAGKNAYGHGAAANVGLGQAESAPPQIALSTAEALSPPPGSAEPSDLLALPAELAPLAQAQLLPSTAQAMTTSTESICPLIGDSALIGEGAAQVANAQLLSPEAGQNVVTVGGTAPADGVTTSVSQLGLVDPSGGAAGFGLASVTTQSLAPITLFAGIEGAETTIAVLRDLQLRATATGGDGAELFYGFVDAAGQPVADSEEVLRINDTVLTSEDVLGGDGLQLSLGVADVFIGAPAHGLDDVPTSAPTVTSTTVAGAVDFIRITVPGTVPTGSTTPVAEDSPLAPVLNPVLMPVVEGLSPVLEEVRAGLEAAGLGVADVRLGHFEALATVPAGGLDCAQSPAAVDPDDPLREARKDVSTRSVAPGATFDYTVRFPNRGDSDLTGVQVVDTYSAALEPVGSEATVTAADGGAVRELGEPTRSGSTLTFDVGTLAPGDLASITITFRVPADAANGTVYRNDATISATFEGAPIERDVSVDGPTVSTALAPGCDVSRSTKYASNLEVVTDQVFAYYVNVTNSGDADCTGVVVTDELDDGVAFVSCSDDCTESGGTVRFDLGTLAAGSARTLAIVVRTTATSGALPNDADVATNEGSTANPATPGPTVTDVSAGAPGEPGGCPATGCPGIAGGSPAPGAGPSQLPRTGAGELLPMLAGLALLGGLAARRRHLAA